MAHRTTDHRSSAAANVALILLVLLVPLIDRTPTAGYDPQTQQPWGCRSCTIPAAEPPPPIPDPGL